MIYREIIYKHRKILIHSPTALIHTVEIDGNPLREKAEVRVFSTLIGALAAAKATIRASERP